MRVNVRGSRGVAILDFRGEITIGVGNTTVRHAIHEALSAGSNKILINMAGVTAIDPDGLGELVSAHTVVTNRGGQLKLVNLPRSVSDWIHVSQLFTVFDVYDDESEAIDSFR